MLQNDHLAPANLLLVLTDSVIVVSCELYSRSVLHRAHVTEPPEHMYIIMYT